MAKGVDPKFKLQYHKKKKKKISAGEQCWGSAFDIPKDEAIQCQHNQRCAKAVCQVFQILNQAEGVTQVVERLPSKHEALS
jgi:hypothetical protein